MTSLAELLALQRGFSRATIFTGDGTLVASVTQAALIRRRVSRGAT